MNNGEQLLDGLCLGWLCGVSDDWSHLPLVKRHNELNPVYSQSLKIKSYGWKCGGGGRTAECQNPDLYCRRSSALPRLTCGRSVGNKAQREQTFLETLRANSVSQNIMPSGSKEKVPPQERGTGMRKSVVEFRSFYLGAGRHIVTALVSVLTSVSPNRSPLKGPL